MGRSHWSNFYRLALTAMFTLALFACSGGGGCSSCEGCGIEPIPGGYPLDQRIDNAAQVRLSSSGIGFIEDNMDAIVTNFLPGGLEFPIDEQRVDAGPITITVCEGGGCQARIEIDSVQLSPTDPNRLLANIQLILDSRDSAGMRSDWPGTCDLDLDTRRGGRPYVGLTAEITFSGIAEDDPVRIARRGYTQIEVENIALDPAADIENDDIDISGGFLGSCNILDLGFIKGFIIGLVQEQLSGITDDALGDSLCTTRGESGCPNGSQAVPDEDPGSICRYGPGEGDECVSTLLGFDGRGDLGGTLIGGFSPGTHAYAQFLLASGGDGEAVNDGMSLFFYGGFMGTDRTFTETPAHNSCVPVTDPPPLPVIARTEAFRGNVIPGTATETHVGIGIAESYLDYAGWGLFDSGALCIGAGTRLSQMLSTGLVSALIGSLNDLTHPLGNTALTVSIRPQQAPDFTIGTGGDTDPILQIDLPQVQIDFYVWSTERYVRFMTFQTDLGIGINLSVADNQLVPTIAGITAENSVVTNSDLLEEDPAVLANVLEGLIGGLAGMLADGLSPFDLPDIMGFQLEVPDGGIAPVSEGGENFLGIFANLALAPPMMLVSPVETTLDVSDVQIDRESMAIETWNQGDGNSAWLYFGAEGPHVVRYEYSYRIDGGFWSPWTTDSHVRIDDELLLFQAKHEIEARARIVGEPASVDQTPARAEVLIDIIPPTVEVLRTAEGIEVVADDIVSAPEDLMYRYQVEGVWSEWTPEASFAFAQTEMGANVEVRDEAGNVGRVQAALIRGLPNPAAGDGCGCRAAGETSRSPLGLLGLLGLGLLFGVRRRRRRGGSVRGGSVRKGALAALLGLSLLAMGCECSTSPPCGNACMAAQPPVTTTGSLCCEATDMCSMYDAEALCEPGFFCAEADLLLDESCNISCAQCTVYPPLEPGELGTYLDAVVDESNNVFLSGYSSGLAGGNVYGDLVFAQYSDGATSWEIVDGAPSSPIEADPAGWRGGVAEAGDDVGRWTSIVQEAGSFMISYYDVSNGALKLAAGGPGSWAIHTVDDMGDSGRYSSMITTSAGVPVIAYLRMMESPMTPGVVNGSVMVATANSANPAGPSDWTITEVATAAMPCRADLCSTGTCIEDGQCVSDTGDCAEPCGAGDVCVMGSCRTELPGNYVEDMPPAYGLYTAIAETPTGLAVVFYDRTAGNVYGSSFDGAAWSAPFLIDGYGVADPFIGDCGQGADLFVDDAGTWHVVYIDGAEETLRYAVVDSSGTVTSTEVVDDGSTLDGMTRFMDGRHIIGDDASIVVAPDGAIRVAYQDATDGSAVVAVRGGTGWAITRIDEADSTGYWIEQELGGSTSYIATFFRQRMGRGGLNSGVRVLTP